MKSIISKFELNQLLISFGMLLLMFAITLIFPSPFYSDTIYYMEGTDYLLSVNTVLFNLFITFIIAIVILLIFTLTLGYKSILSIILHMLLAAILVFPLIIVLLNWDSKVNGIVYESPFVYLTFSEWVEVNYLDVNTVLYKQTKEIADGVYFARTIVITVISTLLIIFSLRNLYVPAIKKFLAKKEEVNAENETLNSDK